MSKYSLLLDKKISSQIQTQFPEFVQSDHSIFVLFLKYYYQFLESAELVLLGSNNYVIEETQTVNYILDTNNEKIVLEDSVGKFKIGETIVGQNSKATARIIVDDFDNNNRLFITSHQLFQPGELVIGQSSEAYAEIKSYKANPVQNIQQFLEYADVDFTLYKFLDKFRDSFMESISTSLATDISKRNLIKNIKELYSAKGTENAHKLFFRILLNEEPEIIYPRDNILRASDGVWSTDNVMRIVENGNSDFTNLIGERIYTKTETDLVKASAIVANVIKFREGSDVISELNLDSNSIIGTFESNEIVYGVDSILDLEISGVIKSIITNAEINNPGFYYTTAESVSIEVLGSQSAAAQIDVVGSGSVDDIMIDDGGSGYEIGEQLIFDNASTEGVGASAKIVVVGGSFLLEDHTDPSHLISEEEDYIITEDGYFVQFEQTIGINDFIILENNDNIIIETETFNDLGVSAEIGEITKIKVIDHGSGYIKLPTVTISTATGFGATVFPVSTITPGIGHAQGISITNFGLNYETSPDIILNRNIIIKNIIGSFSAGDRLSSHDAVVIDFNENNRLLKLSTSVTFTKGDIIVSAAGSSAEVYFSNSATASSTVGTVGKTVGNFLNDRGKISQNTMKLQDSYYYQDFSYVVKIGQSINEWRESLKQSIHPSGWNVFGEVSFSTILRTKVDIPDYSRGSQEFELASLYVEPLFMSIFGRRLGRLDDETTQSLNPKVGFDYLSEINNGEIDVTLRNQTIVSLNVSRGSHYKGSVLANLPKYAFAIPEITSASVIPNYPNPAGTKVTEVTNVTRGLYSIEQFGQYTIKSVSDYSFLRLEEGLGGNGDKILLEDDDGYLQDEILTIPDTAYQTRINVPPPSEITLETV